MLSRIAEEFYSSYSNSNKEQFTEEYQGFFKKFTDCHPGYADVSYPPPVFTAEFIKYLKDSAEFLLETIFSIPERIFNNDYSRLLDFQGYTSDEKAYILRSCVPELLSQAKLLARPDFLLAPDGLKVIEMNVATAIGGIGIADRHAEIFFRTNIARAMSDKGIDLTFHPISRKWADFLYKHSRSVSEDDSPFIFMALIDNQEMDYKNFNSFIGYEVLHFLRANGFRTATAAINELRFENDGVYYKNSRIDIVLTSFIYIEARDAGILDICDKLTEAQHQGLLTFYGITAPTIFDNKANLAILSSDEFAGYFTREEHKKIDELIPKTVKLTCSNMEQVISDRERLVLKECISFGGQNVVLGTNCSNKEWEETVRNVIRKGETYIAQELVEPRIRRAVFEPDGVGYYDMCISACYFEKFAGVFFREQLCSGDKTSLINCAQGAKLSMGFYNYQGQSISQTEK